MASLADPKAHRYSFDDVVVDLDRFCVLKQGAARPLPPRAFDLLVYLMENPDRVIEKQELFERVWKESFVTDNALTQTTKEVRRALGGQKLDSIRPDSRFADFTDRMNLIH